MGIAPINLDELVTNSSAAARLLKQVKEFYGPGFSAEFVDGAVSRFTYDVWTNDSAAASVFIAWQSARRIEASVHELHHLRLPVQGFPLLHTMEEGTGYAPRTLAWIFNEVQHMIFIDNYRGDGFRLDKFLANPPASGYVPAVPTTSDGVLAFMLEYFGLKVAFELGYQNAMTDLAAWRTAAGVSGLPLFRLADELDGWFRTAGFRISSTYEDSIVTLIRILGVPLKTVRFCTLTARSDGAPSITLLDLRTI